jgi:hypothetical protein
VDGPQFAIYVCECGNYVAEPTVELAAREVAHNVRLGGAVYCAAPTHGVHQPEMRRTVVVTA